jgi:hypothetical protein
MEEHFRLLVQKLPYRCRCGTKLGSGTDIFRHAAEKHVGEEINIVFVSGDEIIRSKLATNIGPGCPKTTTKTKVKIGGVADDVGRSPSNPIVLGDGDTANDGSKARQQDQPKRTVTALRKDTVNRAVSGLSHSKELNCAAGSAADDEPAIVIKEVFSIAAIDGEIVTATATTSASPSPITSSASCTRAGTKYNVIVNICL